MTTPVRLALAVERCYRKPTVCSHGVECRVDVSDGQQILAIRGTTDFSDWIANLRFLPVPHISLGWVHAGYLWGAKRATKAIKKRLDRAKPLYIAGHSKAGPESILIAWRLQRDGYNVKSVTTFGAPQFISHGGAVKAFNRLAITQYRNGGDIVPLLPSSWIKLFGHARSLTQLGDKDAETGWEKYHDIKFYIEALENKAANG